jgi:hypothetical protein
VKDRILCEAREPIAIKGISRPVATYRVIDTFERLDRQGDTVREHHPNLLIDMNLAAMSQDERKRAKDTLLQALTRLDVQNGTDESDGA